MVYFPVANLVWVSGGRLKEDILLFCDLRYFYACQILFVDKYCQKAESMTSRRFLNLKKGVAF